MKEAWGKRKRAGRRAATGPVPLEIPRLADRFGLFESEDAIALFPFAAFLEEFDALEALHDTAFCSRRAATFKTWML
jgi:hypothetical protein